MVDLVVKGNLARPDAINQGPPPKGILSKAPLKHIYLLLLFADIFLVQLPIRTVLYILLPRLTRPHVRWGLQRSLFVSLLRRFSLYSGKVDLISNYVDKSILPRVAERYGASAVWIEPINRQTGLQGEMKELFVAAGSTTTRIPAYWYGQNHQGRGGRDAGKDEKVILWLHGIVLATGEMHGSGGFRERSGHPTDPVASVLKHSLAAARYSSNARAPKRGIALEYRLSDQSSFPGIFADALASWLYLVRDLGFQPGNIIIMGDSAGGNLALALVRYIRDERPLWQELHLPNDAPVADGLALFSPWVDVSTSFLEAGPSSSGSRFHPIDFLSDGNIAKAKLALVRGMPAPSIYSKWISCITPARETEDDIFDEFPRTLIVCGGLERFNDEIKALVQHYRAASIDGNAGQVTFLEEPLAVHDFLTLPISFAEEHRRVRQALVKWL